VKACDLPQLEHIKPLNAETGALLVEAVGTPGFARLLLDAARAESDIDEIFGYLVVQGGEPQSLISCSTLLGAEERVSQYLKRFYQHDPAVHELNRIPAGDSFVQRIRDRDIIPYDYRSTCFTTPNFKEKISFGWRGKDYLLVLSFYKINIKDQSAVYNLSSMANLVLALMVNHHATESRDDFIARVERKLTNSFVDLTLRERQVCARTIAGWTASKIAEELGIGAGTVLTYRRRAYQKFGYASSAEFLPKIL
jgi:DNA-binding CsgD family transcriptional regulator